jgi:hypothetical protein
MINQNLIFIPCFSLVLLTGFVLTIMFKRRVSCIKGGVVDPSHYKTYDSGASEPRAVVQASRNFSNLFEAPTLFYMLCIFALTMKVVDQTLLYMAWTYVGLRMVHTVVHITSNKINPRLLSYAFSWIVVLVMAIKILISSFA